MCWTQNISIAFACIHLFTIGIVILKKPKNTQFYIIFCMFYMFMELLQAIQWYIGVYDCSTLNYVSTCIAYIYIWLQPVMFSYISYAMIDTLQVKEKATASMISLYSMVTFIVALMNILFVNQYDKYDIYRTNYGYRTCTYVGEYGHLLWKFNVRNIDLQPSYYVYMSLCIFSFLSMPRSRFKYIISFGWIITFIISGISVDFGPEMPSFWCYLTFICDIPIIINVYIE